MKQFVFFLAFVFVGKVALSQDTIIKTDGAKTIVLVQEVGVDEIKYKQFSTGPTYTIPKSRINRINFADGTTIVINAPAPPPPPVNEYPKQPVEYYKPRDNTPPNQNPPPAQRPRNRNNSSGDEAYYLYFGFRSSFVNSYGGGGLNNYWTNWFANETNYAASNPGYGSIQLNQGFNKFNGLFIGHSFPIDDRKRLNVEFQIDFSSSNAYALYNTASFADGSFGNIGFNLTSLNFAGQYLHGLDVGNRFQVGGEFGIDIGLASGTEQGALYAPINPPPSFSYNNQYYGSGIGAHVAGVAKLFLNRRKTVGLELRAGYRYLQTECTTTVDSGFDQTINVGWSGVFITGGILLQIRTR